MVLPETVFGVKLSKNDSPKSLNTVTVSLPKRLDDFLVLQTNQRQKTFLRPTTLLPLVLASTLSLRQKVMFVFVHVPLWQSFLSAIDACIK